MKKMYGAIPPLITAFKENEDIDEDAQKVLVNFLKERVHGLFVCGSYGSGPLMNVEERKKVFEITAKEVDGKIPLIAHVGTTNLRDSIELAQHAEKFGAERIAAVPPYYYHHTEESILRFYSELVKSVKIPVYIYNNPKTVGYGIDERLILKLAECGVRGIKDSSFDIILFTNYLREAPEDFDVVPGTEAMWLPAAALGAQAFIPGLGNAFPEVCLKLFEAGVKGDIIKGRELQKKVNLLRDVMYSAGSTIVAVYLTLELRGIVKTHPRSPFVEMGPNERNSFKERLIKLGVLEKK
ncbi:dihydrodipicolinate synthase family protein [Candidatus Aerophobetes bacterium]|nr:dihydrodipicolinate synthase family protein [Candidatus Aerophobetes bacterium]